MPKKPILAILALAMLAMPGCVFEKPVSGLNADKLLGRGEWPANQAIMRAAESTGNLELGLQAGRRELDARPENKEARIFLARLQTMAGRPEQALYTLEALADEGSAAARLETARALLSQGEAARARPTLESLVSDGSLSQNEARSARKLMGICEDQLGNRAESQALFRQLLLERDEPSVRFNLGSSLISGGSYDEAIIVLTPLVDSPRFLEARIMAAAAFTRKNDKTSARGLLEGYVSDGEINRLLGEI